MNKNINQQYQELLFNILENGYQYTDTKRDVKCLQIDSATLHIDMTDGFPALTTKRLYWKGVVAELLWFLRGSTDIRELWEHNVHIWDEDWFRYQGKYDFSSINYAIKNHAQHNKHPQIFNLGRIYGAQWRKYLGVSKGVIKYADQISNLIQGMQDMPMSRRHIVNAWNPSEMEIMALPPCHWAFECIVRPIYEAGKRIAGDPSVTGAGYGFTLKWHQRSVDTFLGLPFNIASYALLGKIIEKLTNYKFLGLIGDLSNVHLYENAWDAARELIKRDPMKYPLPQLENVTGFKMDMHGDFNQWINSREPKEFKLKDYESYPNDFDVPMLAPK